jgi:multiple sugar transport system permease protein
MKGSLNAVTVNVLLVLLGLLTALPLLWMISASFMPRGEATLVPPRMVPSAATLANYSELFTRLNLGRSFFNSTVIALGITACSLFFNSMAGYAFAKLRFARRNKIFALLMTAMIIPPQIGMLPLFLMLKQMHLVNSYWGVILPSMATVFGIFLVRQFMLSIPQELLEAGRIDGASEFRIYWTIILPLARPILVTLAIFVFMSSWNDFMWPLIVLTDDSRYTLPVAVANLVGEHVQDVELMMASSVLTVIPVLVLFLLLQRYYIAGLMVGSVKG